MAGRQTVGIWLWTSPNPTFLLHGRSSRFFDWRVAERPWCVDSRLRGNDELRARNVHPLRRHHSQRFCAGLGLLAPYIPPILRS